MKEQLLEIHKTLKSIARGLRLKSFILTLLVLFFVRSTETLAAETEKVVLQLRWNNQFQFSGYYAAEWLGYYDEEGLDVEIRAAFTDDSKILYAPKEVSEGRADFGIGSVDILIAQNNGADLSVISSLFQRSPVEYYMKSDTPYNSIIDITNLNTARRKNDLLDIELQAMLTSEGISPYSSNLIDDTEEFSVNDLITEKYDVIPGYLGTISFYADKEGLDIKVIKPIDYGIDFYGDSLFTRKSLTLKTPELVEKFRRASLKGWEYALEHPEEIADKIAKEFKTEGKSEAELVEFNKFQAEKVIGLTLYPVVEIGNVNPYRWGKMQDTLLKLELIDRQTDISEFIFDYEKILNEKAKRIEKYFMTTIIIGFIALIIFFIVRLATKNTILENEISERKRAEERIMRSKQRYQAIFSSAVLGITITTRQGIILQANEKWLEMTGYSEKELVGRNIIKFIDSDSKKDSIDLMNRLVKDEINSYETEKKYIRKDGNFFWGKLFMTSIYDQDSKRKVNLAMVIDITNQKIEEEAVKRSEKRFRKIVTEVASEISYIDNPDNILLNGKDFKALEEIKEEKNKLSLKLEKINLELERMFKKELDENKRKEALIIYQARLAAMGEMIANIAHQWRQPLNNLGLVLSNFEDAYFYNELDSKIFSDSIEKCRKLISKMSDTIDDFRYFLNPKSEKKNFSVYKNIVSVLDLVEENLRFNNIKVTFETITMATAYGYANQYSQALFNIINNSIDALIDNNSKVKAINISIVEENGMIIVEIKDNGGGIDEEIVGKVFDIYFTTKKESNGTGLGLYMTKTIIENNMCGEINLINIPDGVCMRVVIPKNGGVECASC
ncbi:ABC transporter substrate-binding protein [Wukongibacter baidiensis]|uniref:ABC transporter substrate-binding protein n=1 Tax=Wukongibacter baidiensis TaxID=1723361 RepID=UPI003D7FB28B